MLLHDPPHVSKSGLDFWKIRVAAGLELVSAEAADELRTELKLAKPDLEHLPTARAGDVDPSAPEVFMHNASPIPLLTLEPT
jgi:hypothetical protein